MTRQIPPQLSRRATLARPSDSAQDTRTVRAVLATETPVRRVFGDEVLEISADAVDLSRAGSEGLPLLVNHDINSFPVGRAQNISIESDAMGQPVVRGDLVFSEASDQAREAWALVNDGTLTDVSVQYQIRGHEAGDDETVRITDWQLFEVSIVSVPADASTGIGRSASSAAQEETAMPETTTAAPDDAPASNDLSVPAAAGRMLESENRGREAERARIAGIDDLAGAFPGNDAVQDLARQARSGGQSVEQLQAAIIQALAGPRAEPLAVPTDAVPLAGRSVTMGRTHDEKQGEAMQQALEYRAGVLEGDVDISNNPFMSRSLVEMARIGMEANGVSCRGMSPLEIAGNSLIPRYIEPGTANLTTASYTSLLANTLNKSLQQGFRVAPITYNRWCGTHEVPDFKQGSRPGVSQFTSLAVVDENDPITDGITTDKHESFQVQTWARKYSVTRQAIVNDDLAGLADTAQKMGNAANRTIDEEVYKYVETNPVMNEDATAVFAVGHNNLDSTVDAVPTTENISKVRVAMGNQTDWNSVTLGIVPQFMITPLELEEEMLVLRAPLDPMAQNVIRDNVYRALWEPVSTPRLADKRAWYMVGGRGEHVDVVFLAGMRTPQMARDEGWSVLAQHWRVYIDFTIMFTDWRAAYKFANPAT